MRPFIKWAGGKRWLFENNVIKFPEFSGRYFEPFLGGGAVFFELKPELAVLSDANKRLIETYQAVRDDWKRVYSYLETLQGYHSSEFYYIEREKQHEDKCRRAAQFLYLNRTCYNGLYRENLKGIFNVPIGTKSSVLLPNDDFEAASQILSRAEIIHSDFEKIIECSKQGDLIFVDPPYTTAHNKNGFIKYNQNIFSWSDQVRLRNSIERAIRRSVSVVLTNANHKSILQLYADLGPPSSLERKSVISGNNKGRGPTTEAVFVF